MVVTHPIPSDFRGGVNLYIKTAICNRVSPELIGSRSCVTMAFTAESLPARGLVCVYRAMRMEDVFQQMRWNTI